MHRPLSTEKEAQDLATPFAPSAITGTPLPAALPQADDQQPLKKNRGGRPRGSRNKPKLQTALEPEPILFQDRNGQASEAEATR
jgi:hypothetical protein